MVLGILLRIVQNGRIVTLVEDHSDGGEDEADDEPKYDDDEEEITYADHMWPTMKVG